MDGFSNIKSHQNVDRETIEAYERLILVARAERKWLRKELKLMRIDRKIAAQIRRIDTEEITEEFWEEVPLTDVELLEYFVAVYLQLNYPEGRERLLQRAVQIEEWNQDAFDLALLAIRDKYAHLKTYGFTQFAKYRDKMALKEIKPVFMSHQLRARKEAERCDRVIRSGGRFRPYAGKHAGFRGWWKHYFG